MTRPLHNGPNQLITILAYTHTSFRLQYRQTPVSHIITTTTIEGHVSFIQQFVKELTLDLQYTGMYKHDMIIAVDVLIKVTNSGDE